MKKIVSLFLILLPLFAFCQESVEVPQVINDTLSDSLTKFVPNTIMLSSVFVTIVQVLKKSLSQFKIDISGLKSQALTLAVAVIYVLINLDVWEDGSLTHQDIQMIIESVVSAIAGIFGYKLLWRKPNGDTSNSTNNSTSDVKNFPEPKSDGSEK